MKRNIIKRAAIFVTVLMSIILMATGASAKYSGYIDYDSIYNEKNYEAEFDTNTVIAVMQPEEWSGDDLYAEELNRWPSQPSRKYGYSQIEDFLNTRYPYLDEYMEKFNTHSEDE